MNASAPESNFRFFFRYILHHRVAYAFGIIFIFLTNWLAVNIPAEIGTSIDLLSGELASNQEALIQAITTVIAFALIMVVTRTISRILFFNPGRAIERELKDDAFSRLTRMQPEFFRRYETGSLISIVNNDINGVRALAGIVMLQLFNVLFALSLTSSKLTTSWCWRRAGLSPRAPTPNCCKALRFTDILGSCNSTMGVVVRGRSKRPR